MKKHYPIFLSTIVGLFLLFSSSIAISSDKDCNKDIKTFLDCNNPKVIKYLTALTKKDIGKPLKGVLLTDESICLKNHVFLGEVKDMGQGVHLFVFKFKNNLLAYLWIEENGTKLNLPDCPESVSFESAYVLSGDVYTWKAAQPGDGVIETMCVKEEWIEKLK